MSKITEHTEHILQCNGCGRKIVTQGREPEEFLAVEKQWGYFSKDKDRLRHKFCLCESCYDRLLAGFVLPAEEEEIIELC